MAVSDRPETVPPVCQEMAQVLAEAGYDRGVAPIERHAFYARAREAYAIVGDGHM